MPPASGHERVYRGLLRLYPTEFRTRFGDEMVQLFGDQLRDARAGGAPVGTAWTLMRTLGDLAVTAASEHARRDRTVAHSLAAAPTTASRLLGLVGILGGAVLLAAFLADLSPELDAVRIPLVLVGAMAIVVGVHRRQARVGPAVALLGAVPALLASIWYLVMIILSIGRPHFPEPDPGFRLILSYSAVALWLADAAFGLVTLRLGAVTRWGALALAVGSVLAITGIDRLGLTSEANPTVFGPLSQVGIVLTGIGWILLGIDIATRRRAPEAQPREAWPGG